MDNYNHKGKKFVWKDGEPVDITMQPPTVYDFDFERPIRFVENPNKELALLIWKLSLNFSVQGRLRDANFGMALGNLVTEYLGQDVLEMMLFKKERDRR